MLVTQGRMLIQGNVVFGSAHKPAAACSVSGGRDHCVNSPEICVGSTCWWSLLSWLLCMFPDVSCIRNNWKFTDAFQILFIRVRHGSSCQNDVLGSWINRDVQMGCENSIKQGFLMKMLFKQYVMLGNSCIITETGLNGLLRRNGIEEHLDSVGWPLCSLLLVLTDFYDLLCGLPSYRSAQMPSRLKMLLLPMFSLMHNAFCLLTINNTFVFFCFLGFCESWRLQHMLEVAKLSCVLIQAHFKEEKKTQTCPFLTGSKIPYA